MGNSALIRHSREHAIAGRAGTWALAAVLIWSCLAIGGVPSWAVLGLGALALLAASLNIYAGRFCVDAGVGVLTALGLYTLFQSVFLPLDWLRWFDSDIHRTWARAGQLVGDLPVATLSLEPFTTRLEALKLFSYAAIWGSVSSRAREVGPVYFARWVVWVAVSVFALVFMHWAMGLKRVYGLYEIQSDQMRVWVGPLLNPNNLGGLCNLGAFCALACSTRSERRTSGTPAYLLMAAVLAAMSVLTASRGAVLALLLGALLVIVSWKTLNGRARRFHALGAALLGAGLISVFLAFAATDYTTKELGNLSLSKLAVLELGLDVLGSHPWWGIGRGAFGAEAGTVHGLAQAVVFTYVENFVLEWLVGWGVIVGGLAVVAVATGILRIRGGLRTRVLKIGLCMVLLQNLMDLGLELPGVAVPWLFVFAACWGASARGTWASRTLPSAVALLPTALLGLLWVTLPAGDLARVDRAKVTLARAKPDFDARLAAAIRLHPGDAFLLRLGAVRAAETDAQDSLGWLNAALLRAPQDGRTHLVLAEVLRNQGRTSQALLSLRAAAADPALHAEVTHRVLAWAPERLLDVVPRSEHGVGLLANMAGAVEDLDQRRELLLEARRRAPDNWWVMNSLVEAEIARVTTGAEDCETERAACLRRIRDGIVELEQIAEAKRSVRVLRAREQMMLGDHRAAYDELLVGCERRPSDTKCLNTLLDAARRLDDIAWRTAATAYLDGVCREGNACTRPRLSVAKEFEKRNDWGSALDAYVSATAMATTPDAHIGAARAAQRLGREREALHWVTKAERRFTDAAAQGRLRAVRQSLGGGQGPYHFPSAN